MFNSRSFGIDAFRLARRLDRLFSPETRTARWLLAALCGLLAVAFFAHGEGAAAVLATGTAGPGYYPRFLDQALAPELPRGPRAGLLIAIVVACAALPVALRLLDRETWVAAAVRVAPAPASLLLWWAMPILPLYGQRILFVIGLACFGLLGALPFSRQIRAGLCFARRRWPPFALAVLGVVLLAQFYLFVFAQNDYTAFISENVLENKHKRTLARAGFVLVAIGWCVLLLWFRLRPPRSFARRGAPFWLRSLRSALAVETRTVAVRAAAAIVLLASGSGLLWGLRTPLFEFHNELATVALLVLCAFAGATLAGAARTAVPVRARNIVPVAFALLVLTFCGLAGWRALERVYGFLALNLDLSVEHQALWTLSFHGYPFLSIGAKNGIYDRIYWPDHVPLFYYALAPLYRLIPRVETLVLLQTVFIGAGAVPVFLLTRKITQGTVLAAVAGAAYLLHPGIQLLTQWDVHAVAFAPVLFLFALYFYECGRRNTFLALLLLGGLVREEMGLFVVGVGLMLLLSKRDVRYGLAALVFGTAEFVILSRVIQAYFGGLGHYERYHPLFFLEGEYDVPNILNLLLWNPAYFFRNWWAPEKLTFALQILAPLAFLPLVGLVRWRWPILLAGIASTLLAVSVPNYTIGYQYSVVLLIACFYLLPHGLRLLTPGRLGPSRPRARAFLAAALLLAGMGFSYLYGGLFARTYVLSFMGEWNPDRGQVRWNGWISRSATPPAASPALRELRALLAQVPAEATVAAPERISPFLAGRARNYTLPRIDEAEYIVCHLEFAQDPPARELLDRPDFVVWKKSPDQKSIILKRK